MGAVLTTGDQSIAGIKTFTTQVSVTGSFLSLSPLPDNRSKIRLFGTSFEWGIGTQSATTFGRLNNTAVTFNVPNTDARGWLWGDSGHTLPSQGAMSLTSNGNLTVANSLRIGYGESDTDDVVDYGLDHNGTVRLAGIPSGTIVDSLGLDSNNQVVKGSVASVISGTFTPSLTDSLSGATFTTTTTANYYKIGNRVDFYISFDVTSITGTPTGDIEITGLPFSINYQLNARIVFFNPYTAPSAPPANFNLELITPFLLSGTSFKLIYINGNGNVPSGSISGLTDIIITGSYIST
jgi:hypothetical protein